MNTTPTPSPEARALHDDAIVLDLHGDTLMWMRRGYNFYRRHGAFLPRNALLSHLDEPRMREGGMNAQVFGLVTAPLRPTGQFASAMKQVELLHSTAARRPQDLRVVTEADEVRKAKAEGAIAGMLGLEGCHGIEGDLLNLERMARRGLRLCGLSHFSKNEAAVPAIGWGKNDDLGLPDFGVQVVERCQDLGLIVDLAHINKRGFMDAARRSRQPVVVSHTGVTGELQHPRNIDDEQIRAVADAGGVVGIIYAVNFIGYHRGLEGVVAHMEHVIRVGGEDCVALGSDFDGFIVPVAELHDGTAMPNLTQRLLERGHSEALIRKLLGENMLRVLSDVPHKSRAF